MPILPLYLNDKLVGERHRFFVPNPKYTLRYPKNVNNVQCQAARFMISEFENVNVSYHSQSKSLVWLIEEWCILKNYEYIVEENILGAVKITKIK